MIVRASRSVTMADIAARAGVTKATVSYVLGGKFGRVSIPETTRQRIQTIAQEIGYQKQHAARALATQRTEAIGFIVSDKLSQPMAEYVCAFSVPPLERACKRRGYALVTSTENLSDPDSFVLPRHIGQRRVDGLIFVHIDEIEIVKKFAALGVPCVCIGDDKQISQFIPTVDVDLVSGWFEAVRYAASLGHRRIGFITHMGPRGGLHHVRQVIERARRQPETVQCELSILENAQEMDWGDMVEISYLDQWLAIPRDHRPTLLLGPEHVLPRLMQGMYRKGLHCPRDLSLIALGNASPIVWTAPPLTAVDVMCDGAVAEMAVDLLVDHLQSGRPLTPAESRRDLPCRLLIRESCAPPAREN